MGALWALLGLGLGWAPVAHAQTVQLEGDFKPATRQLDRPHFKSLSKETALYDSWEGDDAHKGKFRYGPFKLDSSLELYFAGYPGSQGVALSLEREGSVERLPLRARFNPSERWTRVRWPMPAAWPGSQVYLVAEDNATGPGGWIGVSLPLRPSWRLMDALSVAGIQLGVFVLVLLPGFSALLLMIPASPEGVSLRGSLTRDALSRLATLVCLGSFIAYVSFFLYFVHPLAGRVGSWAVLAGSVLVLVWQRARARRVFIDREFLTPLMFALLAALFFCISCFVNGDFESPFSLLGNRVLFGLPVDPLLPHWVAEMFAKGDPVRPFFSDWLTSDRPPLQAGFDLMLCPFLPKDLGYVCLGIALQSWVWIGFWLLLRRLGVAVSVIALVFGGALCSNFFFVNTFFCWPKLLPAALLIIAASALWEGSRKEGLSVAAALTASCCAAFALLSHGGSFFAIGGIGVFYLLSRRKLGWKAMILGLATVAVLMTPWTLYQKYYDPPGDRLMKWHLGGHQDPDPRPLGTVLRTAYHDLSWEQIVDYKVANFRYVVGRGDYFASGLSIAWNHFQEGRYADGFLRLGDDVRLAAFMHYGMTLGPLTLGLLGFVWLALFQRSRPLTQAALCLSGLFAGSVVVWCLLMFGPGSTCIHQGSFFTGVCLFAVAGIGLLAFPRWLRLSILCLNALWFFAFGLLPASFNNRDWPNVVLEGGFVGFWIMEAILAGLIVLFLVWMGRSEFTASSLSGATHSESLSERARG